MEKDRREFLAASGLSVAGAALAATSLQAQNAGRAAGANNRITLGIIGCGGMGTGHIRTLVNREDVQIAFVCDPDRNRANAAAQIVQQATNRAPRVEQDLRRVLDQNSVDAVFIATPDHWHAPAAILACNAGKHVYVEKPCAHNIREGRLMIEAARRARKVMQVGTQSRSTRHVQEAIRLLHSGAIGDILVAKVWNSQRRSDIGRGRPGQAPAHLNYDLWVGPAPMVPYQSNRLHYNWHWWYNFGTGDMGNDGVHDLDIGRWGLNLNTHPTTVTAIGGKYFFNDDQEFPDTQAVIFEYPGNGQVGQKRQLIFEMRIWTPYGLQGHENGNAFYGTRGHLVLGKSGGWTLYEGNREVRSMRSSPDLRAHHDNFIECIRSGNRPNADIEINHYSSALCHLGNIAARLGRTLRFDPRNEQFSEDREANALVSREYRQGHWAVPGAAARNDG